MAFPELPVAKQDDLGRHRLQDPRQLFAALTDIFPQFGDAETFDEVKTSDHGLHCTMRNFCEFLGSTRNPEFSDRQLRALGRLIGEAVSVDDKLENAASTCFLEHLRQINRYRMLAPFLSAAAKKKNRA